MLNNNLINLFVSYKKKYSFIIIIILVSILFINREYIFDIFWKRNNYDSLENYLSLCNDSNIKNFKNVQKSYVPKI